jgi:serine/tyrosine/threonine adenylyltransferase
MPDTLPDLRFGFDHSFARLPERFFARVDPTPVLGPRLLRLNAPLAAELGLDAQALAGEAGAAIFAGSALPADAEPIAMVYAGHQFGGFSPQLGDGRAILLGEVLDRNGQRRDIQLKGSGPTPFSRRADGRAALGPVLREYLISEAMTALGVPSTRTLAAALTGEMVMRESGPLPGAVLTRVAASHIRVGSFQFFAARGDVEALRLLADHAIARHDPAAAETAHPYRALYEVVLERQAALVARWMLLGFIHGVMNTDNTTISGETIDYGPCAFMDVYDPETVFSSIDHGGRYAYGNQPRVMQWNLARLAEAMLPIFDENEEAALDWARSAIATFGPRFEAHYRTGLLAKLGIGTPREGDDALATALLGAMKEGRADFTNSFRALAQAAEGDDAPLAAQFSGTDAILPWAKDWRARIATEPGVAGRLAAANPQVIPRNHLVEEALSAATEELDLGPFDALLAVLQRPFEAPPARYSLPPEPSERVYQTFCGT